MAEGSKWMPSDASHGFCNFTLGGTIGVGGAPGYVTALHANASTVDTAPDTDTLRVLPTTNAWDGVARLSAAGSDSIRVDGVDLAPSAAAAGPVMRPNSSILELGCLFETTHGLPNTTVGGCSAA